MEITGITSAAIYSRKSTDEPGKSDDAKSVTRQVEHARAFATARGWHVAAEHVFVDDGISGAEFGDKRPGLVALLAHLPKRQAVPFQALVVSEVSRLGREQFQTGYVLAQLARAGVRIFTYLDGKEADLTDPTSKFRPAALRRRREVHARRPGRVRGVRRGPPGPRAVRGRREGPLLRVHDAAAAQECASRPGAPAALPELPAAAGKNRTPHRDSASRQPAYRQARA